MTLEELLRDERKAGEAQGKAEGIATGIAVGRAEGMTSSVLLLLSDKGTVPASLREKILAQQDPEILARWLRLAASAASVGQFEQEI